MEKKESLCDDGWDKGGGRQGGTMARIRRLKHVERPLYFVTTNTFGRGRWFLDTEYADVAMRNIHHLDDRGDVENIAFVVMPDHLHLLFEIKTKKTVSEIMHDLKSHIAHEMALIHHRRSCHASSSSEPESRCRASSMPRSKIPLMKTQPIRTVPALSEVEGAGSDMGRKYVRVWQRSFYDHVIMDGRDLWTHVEYIRRNPVKAGLVRRSEDYPWLSVRDRAAISSV